MPGLSATAPCGMWLSVGQTDYIFFEANTSRLHSEHIILHELGHILSDHALSTSVADSVFHQLMPDLDPSTIRRVLGRVSYTNEQEQEAEMLASLVRAKARYGQVGLAGPDRDLAQIAEALSYPD
jgi:hypothetical protein